MFACKLKKGTVKLTSFWFVDPGASP